MGVLKDIELYLASADRLNDDGVPSASIALLEDPFGPIQSHVITNSHENPNTLYQACSISKAITALAVAKLIDQGRLSYETKVVDHVDEAVLEGILDPRTAHLMELVTVGLLVSHRSGLSQHGFNGYAREEEVPNYQQVFAGRPPANSPRMRFLSFPGSQCKYSGGGFTLLQLLLEKATGTPFADLMRIEVLEPLGMTRSHYGDLPPSEQNYAKPHATAYTPSPQGPHRFLELAAAGLWTTPTDLLKAVAAIQHSLHSDDNQQTFLSRQIADHMLARVTPNDPDNAISFGWSVDDTFFAHSGYNDPGYSCYVLGAHGYAAPLPFRGMVKSPGRMSIAVMTNSALGAETYQRIVAAVMCFKAFPLYPTLPDFGRKMSTLIPYPGPEGIFIGDLYKSFLGHWTQLPPTPNKRSTPGASPSTYTTDAEWEIFDDNGIPYIAFDGVVKPQRLIGGAMPWAPASGAWQEICLILEGLEMAVRLVFGEDGEARVELVQEEITVLRRVRGAEDGVEKTP
ncbi:hypothetical protein PRZ48_010850 [Zasmidium cellare]|uniref:Beta-lactamase-related domain-containing protein n=1 Tax=Zasmidium cellare TaxID=395010 RepID=A0ABR0EAN8_ZASCE|nr:hypothetical protein PRZ48_010850 [Zasmidium cellare]